MTWAAMDPFQQEYLADALYGAVPDHELSVWQTQINQRQERQREALASELAKEAAAHGLPPSIYGYDHILGMLKVASAK